MAKVGKPGPRVQRVVRIVFFLVAVGLIVNWLPRYGNVRHAFSEGEPWRYEDLVADRSFAISKTPEELEAERARIAESVDPYYVVDADIRSAQLDRYQSSFKKKLGELRAQFQLNVSAKDSARYISLGERVLHRVYQQGVFDMTAAHRLRPSGLVNFVQGTEVRPRKVSESKSRQQASAWAHDTLRSQETLSFLYDVVAAHIVPNVLFDSLLTQQYIDNALEQVSTTAGGVLEGERVVSSGEVIDHETYKKLLSYYELEKEARNRVLVFIGYFILTALLFLIFGRFLRAFTPDVFQNTRKLGFILFLITGFVLMVNWAAKADLPSNYVIPFCVVPIILSAFFGTQLALFAHVLVILLSSFIVPEGIAYTVINILAGIVAIFTSVRAHYWSQFFGSIGLILLTYCVGFFGISLLQEGALSGLAWVDFGWIGLNVFLTLLAYPLILIFEKLFGYVSDITLMEWLRKPLLDELSITAGGTYQHSLQVSNLAEKAAQEIGANSLLAKVGSMYHDIGKMTDPTFFIENQSGANPHDDLPFEKSATIIIGHVPKGVEIARKHRLPRVLIDFIETHHGTTRVEYFYRSYLKNFPDQHVDDAKFRYPGPLPFSKETAVVMMADTVEAASRSLKEPTQPTIDELVEKLIDQHMRNGQFREAPITFHDITRIKRIFKKMLHSIYHVRVEYPQ
jgi:putative nucleotidyltransferase with HDIG domain